MADLTEKCSTLMASDTHQISLFMPCFIYKLTKLTVPFVFSIYLLPYISWLNCSILKQLAKFSHNKQALKMIDDFINCIDYNKPITWYHIPEFSTLLLPLDNSEFILLITKHNDISGLILQDLINIKKALIMKLEITDFAINLSALCKKSHHIYWSIPKQIYSLVKDKLIQHQMYQSDNENRLTAHFPMNHFADLTIHQSDTSDHLINFKSDIEDSMEV